MIREEAARAREVAKMKEGELLVVGCSSSEMEKLPFGRSEGLWESKSWRHYRGG